MSDNDNTFQFTVTTDKTPRDLIREELEALDLGGDGDGVSEERIIELIDKHAEAQIDYDRLADEVAGRIDVGDGSFGEERLARIDAMLARLELSVKPTNKWAVGPESPSGRHHSNPLWGTHLSADRPLRLGDAVIDANQSAEFTVRLYRYEGGEIQGVEDETTISANGREQEVTLDLHAGPGEYLLARPVYDERHGNDDYDDLPEEAFVDEEVGCALRRVSPDDHSESDFESYSKHGVTFYGTSHPVYSDNSGYYYFFDMDVATGPEVSED